MRLNSIQSAIETHPAYCCALSEFIVVLLRLDTMFIEEQAEIENRLMPMRGMKR
jgi:hypothetical protein